MENTHLMFLGIETSCDETALALIQGNQVVDHLLYSQIQEHTAYGGVVPMIAARAHGHHLPLLARRLFSRNGLSQITGIAVTAGPGLLGGLLVGTLFAKGLALSLRKPVWPVHHLAAHGLMVRLFQDIAFPYLLLLLSGGHCQIVWVQDCDTYRILGRTLDDAVGECIDKVARALGLGYPGGPIIECLAQKGDPNTISLPIPLKDHKGCDFSFSGLKTACMHWIQKQKHPVPENILSDFCASFQKTIADSLCTRLQNALQQTHANSVVMSGGVAANRYFYERLNKIAPLVTPPVHYCTDNAVMVAWAGQERHAAGKPPNVHFETRARWCLEDISVLR